MGANKVFRYFSAMAVRWTVNQDMADFKEAYEGAEKEDLVHMKAGHLVKISFGNDRVRTEPWLIRCFRHANVHDVAEQVPASHAPLINTCHLPVQDHRRAL